MTSQVDMWVCLFLTIGAVIANYCTSIRALRMSLVLNSCPWLVLRGSRHISMQLLLGISLICFYLGSMKTWSVIHVFLVDWHILPHTYHVESFMYLLENYGVAIVLWKTSSFIKYLAASNRPDDLDNASIGCENAACIKQGECIVND